MKKISVLLIILGVIVISYPYAHNKYQDYRQEKILEEWEKSLEIISVQGEASEDFDTNSETAYELDYNEDSFAADDGQEERNSYIEHTNLEIRENDRREQTQTNNNDESLHREDKQEDKGNKELEQSNKTILKIDKIDLYLPILEGVTEKNLDITLSHFKETAKVGEVGNYGIAGHRSYTYGRHFNRLNEVEVGDKIKVFSNGKEYTYEVHKKFIVEPKDVWVLEGNKEDSIITLVTCHPIRVATHRLIIQGTLQTNNGEK